MKIKSLGDIPEAVFYPLKQWVEASPVHLNILVGFGMLLCLGVFVSYILLVKRVGKPDERTNGIYKNMAYVTLCTMMVCDIIFPRGYMMNQFFFISIFLLFLRGLFICLGSIGRILHNTIEVTSIL